MDEVLDVDCRVALVLADISAAQLASAKLRYPGRVINVGIREQLLISVAGGLALSGMRPVAHTFASFLVERPFEQVKLDLGHQGVGAVLVSSGASYDMSYAGRTHQSPGDVALIDSLPGWTVNVPGHRAEARRLLLESLPGDGKVYLRLSDQANAQAHLGAGFRVLRQGSRGVVLAVGPILDHVLRGDRRN
jgi:transketolase